MDEEQYEVNFLCLNCGCREDFEFDCGKLITKKLIAGLKCEECECQGYMIKNLSNEDIRLCKELNNILVQGIEKKEEDD